MTIKIIDSELADQPTKVDVTSREENLKHERRAYEMLKAKFEQEKPES